MFNLPDLLFSELTTLFSWFNQSVNAFHGFLEMIYLQVSPNFNRNYRVTPKKSQLFPTRLKTNSGSKTIPQALAKLKQ
jgi:hypothetical protein